MSINRPVLLIIAGAALAASAALAVPAWRHLHELPPPPPPALRLTLPPDGDRLSGGFDAMTGTNPDHPFGLALSPDGRRVAFAAAPSTALRAGRSGAPQIWVRDLTTGDTAALPGTEQGVLPFWSRDGRQVGFFADGRLKALSLDTKQISDLAEAAAPRGGTWDRRGDIIFSPRNESGLMRRRVADGTIEPLTTLDAQAGETSHRFPCVSEDGRYVVYFVRAAEPQRSGIWMARVDNPQQRARLAGSNANGLIAGDWLIYARDDALLAQQLITAGTDALPAATGRAQLIGRPVGQSALNQLSATVAADTIVFGAPQPQLRDLRWIDRDDGSASTLAGGIEAWDVRVAPTGGRVAVTERDQQLGTLDVQMYEGGRPLPRRISQAIGPDESPVWSRDSLRLAWVQTQRTITVRSVLAGSAEEAIRTFDLPVRLWDWSADGEQFVVGYARPGTREDIFLVTANGTGESTAYAQSAFNDTHAAISPDGFRLAYASDESGQPEIYMDSLPTPGHRVRLSVGGGSEPRWSKSGNEVFFRRGSEIHMVTVSFNGDVPVATSTTRLFDAGGKIRSFDVSADGERMLVNVPSPGVKAQPISVVVNWRSLLGSPASGGSK
jgi:serine/threonine-protein kinase